MKLWTKAFFVIMGLLIFFFSGGVACTYFSTGVDLVLTTVLGVLVFVTAGGIACTFAGTRIKKQK